MGFPESLLVADERLMLHCHSHAKRLVPAVLVLFALSALAGLAAGLVGRSDEPLVRTAGSLALVVVWAGIVGWWTLRPWLRWRSTHFLITDRRVAYRTGFLSRRGIDMPMRRINAVEYRQSLSDRLFGCGTLSIESAGDEPVEFNDIPHITSVHALLYGEAVLGAEEEQ